MSRLESAIRRLQAQRLCLDHAGHLIKDVAGPIFELGLGNGRTYDYLRILLPVREIFVFDRQVAAHPDCIPDDEHMFVGEFSDILARVRSRFRHRIALIHADIGSGVEQSNRKLARFLGEELPGFLTPGGILLSDQEFQNPCLIPTFLPAGVAPGRYYFYEHVDR